MERPTFVYVPSLDGLRAFAVIAVMVYHSGFGALLARGGWVGVDIFFVLSGFLITTILLQERAEHGRFSIRRFYARRIVRLVPAFAVFLAVFTAWTVSTTQGYERSARLDEVVLSATYRYNFHLATTESIAPGLGHTWSLSAEEQFYLLWPIVLAVVLSWKPQWTLRVALTLVGLSVALRTAQALGGTSWEAMYFRPETHFDGLLIGCALAILYVQGSLSPLASRVLKWAGPVGLAMIIFIILCVPVQARWLYVGGLMLIELATACVIASLVLKAGPLARIFELRPLVFLGRLSYSLYLWHVLAFGLVTSRGALDAPLSVVLAVALASGSYYLVERPVLRLKRRYSSRASGVPPHEDAVALNQAAP